MPRISNPYIFKEIFNRRLNSVQESILETGKLPEDLSQVLDQEKAYVCYLLGKARLGANKQDAEARYQLGVGLLKLSALEVATNALLCGDLEVFALSRKALTESQLRSLLSSYRFYNSAIASGNAIQFESLLGIRINAHEIAKDLLIPADFQNFFREACRLGDKSLSSFLCEILGKDKTKTVVKENNYYAYRLACGSGCQAAVSFLHEILDVEETKAAIRASGYWAYQEACRSGNQVLVTFLHQILGANETIAAIKANDYSAYQKACLSGNHSLVACLHQALGIAETKNAIKADNYRAYQLACRSGSQALVAFLHKTLDTDNGFVKARYYEAYLEARRTGQQALLHKALGLDTIKTAIKANHYEIYNAACRSGHQELVSFLHKTLGLEETVVAIRVSKYRAYQTACRSGNQALVSFLHKTLGLEETKTAIKADDYRAYQAACSSGNQALVSFLHSTLSIDEIKAAIKADDYKAYQAACESGNQALISFLHETLDVEETKAAIRASGYWAYSSACGSGHQALVSLLHEILGAEEAKTAIKARDYRAYQEACRSGCQILVSFLLETLGVEETRAAIRSPDLWSRADCYGAYHGAFTNNRLDIAKLLLEDLGCFSYAEEHDEEYGQKLIYDYVSLRIRRLRSEKEIFEFSHPNGVFNVSEVDASYYFLMLRNLIRRGVEREYYRGDIRTPEDVSDELRFLLSIPAVRRLAHKTVRVDGDNPGQENELLRLANRIGNASAAQILLQLPDVRRLAVQHDYYRREAQGDLELSALAQNREPSMTTLSVSEKAEMRISGQSASPSFFGTSRSRFDDTSSSDDAAHNSVSPRDISDDEETAFHIECADIECVMQ